MLLYIFLLLKVAIKCGLFRIYDLETGECKRTIKDDDEIFISGFVFCLILDT